MPEDERFTEVEELPLARNEVLELSETQNVGDLDSASERLLAEDVEAPPSDGELREIDEPGGSRPPEVQGGRQFLDEGEAAAWRLEHSPAEGDRAAVGETERLAERRAAEREFKRVVVAGEVEFQEPAGEQVQTDELILDEISEREFDPEDERFWDHHGNDRAFYKDMAEGYNKEIEPLLEQGMTPEELRKDPERAELAGFWWNEGDPIRVSEHKGHQHLESGYHRYFAAKEAGIENIPAQVRRTKQRG